MIDLSLTAALAAFYERSWCTPAYAEYLRAHHLDVDSMTPFAGATAVLPIIDHGRGRFDFGRIGIDQLGFVHETIAADGEGIEDLVAWPLTDPSIVLTMFGRTGIIGQWEAFNPATYYMGKPLVLHRTGLDWLKASCRGAAIADKRIAARQFLDLPGHVAGQDQQHGRELLAIAESLIDRSRFVAARQVQDAA